jgi:hypothetical protein
MRFLHGRVVENGNHNQSESSYTLVIRNFRKGSVDPSSPRREASLLTWPGNLTVFGPFFFVPPLRGFGVFTRPNQALGFHMSEQAAPQGVGVTGGSP